MEPSSEGVQIIADRRDLPLRIRLRVSPSDEALFDFCQKNRDLRIERSSEGDLIVMSPTGAETSRRNFTLTAAFGAWVASDGTGVGFDSSTGFLLPNGAERAPDLAWVKRPRWEALTAEQRRRFAPLCPDFVVELRSPTDDLDELHAKMREYADNGAALGWLIDADARRVWIYRPGPPAESLDAPATLGDPLLPGFVLVLATIW